MCLQGHLPARRAETWASPQHPSRQKSLGSNGLFPGVIADSKTGVNQGPERRPSSSLAPTPPTPSLPPLCYQLENKLSPSSQERQPPGLSTRQPGRPPAAELAAIASPEVSDRVPQGTLAPIHSQNSAAFPLPAPQSR